MQFSIAKGAAASNPSKLGTHFVRVHLSKATEATRVLGLIEESWLWLGRWAYQQTHVYLSQLFLLLFFSLRSP